MAWVKISSTDQFEETDRKTYTHATVFKVNEQYFATENRCPHMGYPMSKGTIRDNVITCAWHNWDFDTESGGCYRGGCHDLKVYPLKIEGDSILIDYLEAELNTEEVTKHITEAMRSADKYQLAKAIAFGIKSNISSKKLSQFALLQAYKHSSRNHQTAQAVYESQAISDSFELSQGLPKKEVITTLLHGISTASGSTGDRMVIEVLPDSLDRLSKVAALIKKYTHDASPLAIERVLKTTKLTKFDLHALLLDIISEPYLLFERELITTISAIIHVDDLLNAEEDLNGNYQAMASWVLGSRKPSASHEQAEAINWLKANQSGLHALTIKETSSGKALPLDELQMILDGNDLVTIFDKLLKWLKDAPSFEEVLNSFSLLSARRLARLWLNNGGLWNSATEGIRLCNSIRQISKYNARACQNLLFHLAAYFFETRWLQNGEAYKPKNEKEEKTIESFQKLFEANNVKAKETIVQLISDRTWKSKDMNSLIAVLVNEDLTSLQLNTIIACLKEQEHVNEWQPYLEGLVTYMMDMKASQNTKSAAKFGISYL